MRWRRWKDPPVKMKRARKKRQSCAHLEKVVVDAVLQTKLQLSTSRSKERAVMLEDGPILIESDEENAVDMDLDRLLLEGDHCSNCFASCTKEFACLRINESGVRWIAYICFVQSLHWTASTHSWNIASRVCASAQNSGRKSNCHDGCLPRKPDPAWACVLFYRRSVSGREHIHSRHICAWIPLGTWSYLPHYRTNCDKTPRLYSWVH